MNSFDSFLNPERKPNIRFKLSPYPDEFEMRLLSAEEDREILRRMQGDKKLDGADALIAYAAEALVVPDLHNADFQDKLSKKAGRPILVARRRASRDDDQRGAVGDPRRIHRVFRRGRHLHRRSGRDKKLIEQGEDGYYLYAHLALPESPTFFRVTS